MENQWKVVRLRDIPVGTKFIYKYGENGISDHNQSTECEMLQHNFKKKYKRDMSLVRESSRDKGEENFCLFSDIETEIQIIE